jgi:hypothetical protein
MFLPLLNARWNPDCGGFTQAMENTMSMMLWLIGGGKYSSHHVRPYICAINN